MIPFGLGMCITSLMFMVMGIIAGNYKVAIVHSILVGAGFGLIAVGMIRKYAKF